MRVRVRTALIGTALVASSLSGGMGARAEEPPADYPVPPTPADYRRPQGKLVPPEGALFGVHLDGYSRAADEQAPIEQMESEIGRKYDINHYYYPWDDEFPTWREQYDFAHGRFPLIAWGCVDVDEILSGQWDALIDQRGAALAALERPLFLRWCWEMDGRRPEKKKKVKSPEKFIAAWQYLWQRVYAAGATNVVRVWCPNARGFKTGDAQPFYPGDEWVDWVCTDGYNWAPGRKEDWRSFVEIFDESYQFAVSRYKPLMIGEWGAQERQAGEKAAWITAAQVATRERLPGVAAVLVFSVEHLFDWQVNTSPESYQAFKDWAADPYFNVPDPAFTPGPGESTAPGPLGPPGYPGVEKKEGENATGEGQDEPADDSGADTSADSADTADDDGADKADGDGADKADDDGRRRPRK